MLSNHFLHYFDSGVVSTVAGGGGGTVAGYANGYGTAALFSNILSIAVNSNGDLFVCEGQSGTIRKISSSGKLEIVIIFSIIWFICYFRACDDICWWCVWIC